MKTGFAVTATVLAMSSSLMAQDAQPREGAPREEGRGRFVMPNPLFDAIDTNSDGVISAEELANATASLKKLDKDGDGKITREEARPEFPNRGGGNFGNRGGRGEGATPGGRGRGPGAGAGGGEFSVERFVAQYMERDANKDGKLDATELGERGARMLQTNDTNGDGFIDEAELKAAGEALRERFQNRSGNRPQGNRPQGGGGGRGGSSDNNT